MEALSLTLAASGAAATANFFFRKNGDKSLDNANRYLLFYFIFSFVLSLAIYYKIWTTPINFAVIAMGSLVGLLNVLLMILTSKALQQGPAGITFAFQNASFICPPLLLFLMMGPEFGFTCSGFQLLGLVLVVLGLFMGAKGSNQAKTSVKWFQYACGCLAVQVLALTVMQGRCVLFEGDKLSEFFSFFSVSHEEDVWFMPVQFATSIILQGLIVAKEKKKIQKHEISYGLLAGLANGIATSLLLVSTKLAGPWEKGLLLPFFAVATIILCSAWASIIYRERFNIPANATCALGVAIATWV